MMLGAKTPELSAKNMFLADTCGTVCGLSAIPTDGTSCVPFSYCIRLLSLPDEYEYYSPLSGNFVVNLDGTAEIEGDFVSSTHPNAFLHLEIFLHQGLTWEEWDDQLFPTGYVADCNAPGELNEFWTYYLANNDLCKISGYGDLLGTEYSLVHAPANNYFAYQVGDGANHLTPGYGSGGWFTALGVFSNTATGFQYFDELALNVYFLHDCNINVCTSDFNFDGAINVTDLILFTASFGCTNNCSCADLDGNGTVSVSDLLLFSANFGQICN